MAKWERILFSVAFSFMFLFISVGYAALADTMTVTGTSEYTPAMDKVIFTKAEVHSAVGGTSEAVGCYYPTTVGSTLQYDGSSEYLDVTYKITAKNYSSTIKYAYMGIACDETLDNENSLQSSEKLLVDVHFHDENGDEVELAPGMPVEPGQELTLYIDYSIAKDNIPDDRKVKTLLNFKFGYHTDSAGEAATQEIFTQFLSVLNDPAKMKQIEDQIAVSEDLKTLLKDNILGFAIENRNYIGNVAGSPLGDAYTQNEQNLIKDLFGDTLKITTINAEGEPEEHNVQVIIQSKDINGDDTDELILYMTTSDIYNMKITKANIYIDNIYATMFVNDTKAGWIQAGDMYKGRAIAGRINTAGGSPSFLFRADSFAPDTWVSVESEYKVTEEYSYSIAAGQSVSAIIAAPAENEAWNTLLALYETAQGIDLNDYAADKEVKQALIDARTNISAMISAGSGNAKQVFVTSAILNLQAAMSPFKIK